MINDDQCRIKFLALIQDVCLLNGVGVNATKNMGSWDGQFAIESETHSLIWH